MKYQQVSFAVACLLSTSKAVKLRGKQRDAGPWTWDSSKTPWDKESLPECPSDPARTIMDDGKTHVSKYPNVGSTCRMQKDASLVQFVDDSALVEEDPRAGAMAGSVQTLEHCPDFNERFTLKDGKTKGVPYPEIGFNCNPDYQLQEKNHVQLSDDPNWGAPHASLPHCPDFDERFTLNDGKTRAVPYPQVGYNCTSDYQLAQKKDDPNWGPAHASLPHCPDFDERFTLTDGKTRAVPYPQVGYNCTSDYQLAQKKDDPNWGPAHGSLPHCPDFDERFTLNDGKTRAVPYPQVGYNCTSDYQLAQKKDDPNWGPAHGSLPHCPDFDERFTLNDGKTRAVPYPQVGYNCSSDYQLAEKKDPNWGPAHGSLPHCPDFDERFTLNDGKTRAVPYPDVGYNCTKEYQLVQDEPNWGPAHASLPHCPDFDERFTLTDGKTRAVPYPQVGYNCTSEYQLAEKKDPNWGAPHASLPHCPDFDERFTLTDGRTRAVPYPEVGYNCTKEYQLAEKKDEPNWGPAHASLPHCPDFDERFTLTDGKTRAVPYPQVGYNCTSDYQLAQKKDIASDIAGLQHCPDFDERFTLVDGKTRAVPYPQTGFNCNPEYAVAQKTAKK